MKDQNILVQQQSQIKINDLEVTVASLEKKIQHFNQIDEERKQLEKLVYDQQKIIGLALTRIVPKKTEVGGRAQFCMVMMKGWKLWANVFILYYRTIFKQSENIRLNICEDKLNHYLFL